MGHRQVTAPRARAADFGWERGDDSGAVYRFSESLKTDYRAKEPRYCLGQFLTKAQAACISYAESIGSLCQMYGEVRMSKVGRCLSELANH